jgi:hypothetical protein
MKSLPSNLRLTKGVHYYTPSAYEESGRLTVCYRLLSEKELRSIDVLYTSGKVAEAAYRIADLAIVKIEDELSEPIPLSQLPINTLYELTNVIIHNSAMTEEELAELDNNIFLYTDGTLESETWNCELCREKRLDKVRNCRFLSEEEQERYFDPNFRVDIGDRSYNYCPVFDINKELLSAVIECNNLLELGFLPDEGGFLDQTRFFVTASQQMKFALQKAEIKKLKEQQK